MKERIGGAVGEAIGAIGANGGGTWSMVFKVEVLTGLPGCGKSYDMRQEAIHNPGLYLFA